MHLLILDVVLIFVFENATFFGDEVGSRFSYGDLYIAIDFPSAHSRRGWKASSAQSNGITKNMVLFSCQGEAYLFLWKEVLLDIWKKV